VPNADTTVEERALKRRKAHPKPSREAAKECSPRRKPWASGKKDQSRRDDRKTAVRNATKFPLSLTLGLTLTSSHKKLRGCPILERSVRKSLP